jgi:hydrogenase maturation protease
VLRVLLIGYGNTLRGDDALGPMAVEHLRPLLPNAECLSCQQLAPELAERLADCELALFVDAACDGEPGEVRIERLTPKAGDAASSLTHHVNAAALLELAQTLYGRAPQAALLTGTGAAFGNYEGLSEPAQQALDEVCKIIPLLIQDFHTTG